MKPRVERRPARSDVDEAAWKDLGDWIEQLRVRSGLTVGELAQRADVSRVWLQVLRKGGRRIEGHWRPPNPKQDALARVARVLDVPVEEMLARAGGAPPRDGQDQELVLASDAAARVPELEQRVEHLTEEVAELRRLLEERARRASGR
jgi:transcriptional regulator with XRE-family HTH domain